jgi:hypothetical protein
MKSRRHKPEAIIRKLRQADCAGNPNVRLPEASGGGARAAEKRASPGCRRPTPFTCRRLVRLTLCGPARW